MNRINTSLNERTALAPPPRYPLSSNLWVPILPPPLAPRTHTPPSPHGLMLFRVPDPQHRGRLMESFQDGWRKKQRCPHSFGRPHLCVCGHGFRITHTHKHLGTRHYKQAQKLKTTTLLGPSYPFSPHTHLH